MKTLPLHEVIRCPHMGGSTWGVCPFFKEPQIDFDFSCVATSNEITRNY